MLLSTLLTAIRQRHTDVVTCRCHKLCKMEYFLRELLKGPKCLFWMKVTYNRDNKPCTCDTFEAVSFR